MAQIEIDRPERVQFSGRGRKHLGDAAQRDVCLRHTQTFGLSMILSENPFPLFGIMLPQPACYFGVLRSSGRKLVSIILARSKSPVIAPTIFCTSIMRFMPSRWNWPGPQ